MPRKKASTRRRTGALTLQDKCVLQWYFDWFGPCSFDRDDRDEVLEMWDIHGETIMVKWQLDKHRAGKRPFAFWVKHGQPCTYQYRPENETERLREMGELSEAEEKIIAKREADNQARLHAMRGLNGHTHE